jgi:hypothetical protein
MVPLVEWFPAQPLAGPVTVEFEKLIDLIGVQLFDEVVEPRFWVNVSLRRQRVIDVPIPMVLLKCCV